MSIEKKLTPIGKPQSALINDIAAFLKRALPYLIILVASFIPFSIYFKGDVINTGDDVWWHLIYTWDLNYGMDHGFSGISTSHTFFGFMAYDTYLFYAPFPHYFVIVLYRFFRDAGATIVGTLKFTAILSVFLSGIFTYWLALKLTNKNVGLSLAAAIAYVFMPYRLYNFFYRMAYCEAIAQMFIPMLFLGLVGILHDKEFRISNYIYTLLGVALLVLSHPFTALITVAAALVFILANILNVIRVLKDWRNILAASLSILFIVGLIAFYFFPMQAALKTGYYRMSDPEAMWMTVDNLLYYIPYSYSFSGLLNSSWLVKWISEGHTALGETPESWMWDIILFLVFSGASIFALNFFEKKEHKTLAIVLAIGLALTPIIFTRREEVLLAIMIFVFALLFVHMHQEEQEALNGTLLQRVKETARNPEIYVLIGVMVLGFLYLFAPFMWENSPEILRNCQFPFRFWGLVQFLVIIILVYVAKPFLKWNFVREIGIGLACFVFVVCQGPVDKRIAYVADWNNGAVWGEPDLWMVQATDRIGVMNEYMPNVFYETGYVSKYSNSLYPTIRQQIIVTHKYTWDPEEYIVPAVLEGEMEIEVTEINSPNVNLHITVTSDEALYQLQQFYYDGYVATYSGGSTYQAEGEYIDGLVAFKAKKGEYDVKIEFVGSKIYRFTRPLFYISVVGVTAMGLGFTFVPKIVAAKRRKKETQSN